LKRPFDIVTAAAGLLVASPVMVVIAACVRLTSRGPAIYRATRVGRGGSPFTLYKFRSMRVDQRGHRITAAGDPRITRVGRLLRSTKLDELPQFINVLRGDMSIVGPRPEDPKYVESYNDEQRQILKFRPGLTSPASIRYRHEESLLAQAVDVEAAYAAVSDAKILLDLAYFPSSTFRSDLAIMVKTIASVFRRHSSEFT
jgi:lipopolysaccharide/colanic/teichoic acid biosynthesis glycosyltransferase